LKTDASKWNHLDKFDDIHIKSDSLVFYESKLEYFGLHVMDKDYYWQNALVENQISHNWLEYMVDPRISRFRDVIVGLTKLQKMFDPNQLNRCLGYSECGPLGDIVKKDCPSARIRNFYDPQLSPKTSYFDSLITNVRICYGNNQFLTDSLKLNCSYVKFLNSGGNGNPYLSECNNSRSPVVVKFNKILATWKDEGH
jgi:hypothetical protein